ncbi:STAS-like domain-containing protein [Pantoea ananatis]|uniref:STAS-like domain-containing protein n=1 Tax=Pantoea ananas TaxID=553 RepID=UPI000E231B5E|nr:STAS-like domain-containing protein [Pantoea ananatis]REC88720.1 uncharacterized protein DUF4325 [Pantoea ananatis]
MEERVYHFNESTSGFDIIEKLVEIISSCDLEDSTLSYLLSCGSEVVLNSMQHGYPDTYRSKEKNIFSVFVNYDDDALELVLLDYGATIPVTILNKLPALATTQQDDQILNMAMAGELYLGGFRGKGLPSLLGALENENILNLKIHSGIAYFEANSAGKFLFQKKNDLVKGTKVTFKVTSKNFHDEPEAKSITLVLSKTLSSIPFGRYKSDSSSSGQHLREDHLVPALEKYDLVNLELDGPSTCGSSFLEEAFGGLVREHGYDIDVLLSKLNIISDKPFLTEQAIRYIKGAK